MYRVFTNRRYSPIFNTSVFRRLSGEVKGKGGGGRGGRTHSVGGGGLTVGNAAHYAYGVEGQPRHVVTMDWLLE